MAAHGRFDKCARKSEVSEDTSGKLLTAIGSNDYEEQVLWRERIVGVQAAGRAGRYSIAICVYPWGWILLCPRSRLVG